MHAEAPDGAESRRGRAQDFLNRCEVDITASCGECRVKAIRREDQTMLSRRSFLKSTLGAGLALATHGCQQMVAQPVRRRTIVDSQVHLWKAESADWPWVPGAKPQLPEPFTIEKLVPMMDEAGVGRAVVVPTGRARSVARTAERGPRLARLVGPVGVAPEVARTCRTGHEIEPSVSLATYPTVSVKLSSAPLMSKEPYPYRDVNPHIRRLFDAY